MNSYFKISKPHILLVGTGLADLVLNICLNFVVNEHYNVKFCLSIGNAVVLHLLKTLGLKNLQDIFIKCLIVICNRVCFAC